MVDVRELDGTSNDSETLDDRVLLNVEENRVLDDDLDAETSRVVEGSLRVNDNDPMLLSDSVTVEDTENVPLLECVAVNSLERV